MSSILEALKQAEKDKNKLLENNQYKLIKDHSINNNSSVLRSKKALFIVVATLVLSISVFSWPKIKIFFRGSGKERSNLFTKQTITKNKKKTLPIYQNKTSSLASVAKNSSGTKKILLPRLKETNKISDKEDKITALKHNKKGVYYYKQGELTKAITEFENALNVYPRYDQAHYNLGIIYDDQGLYNQAIKEYHRALLINPKYEEAYINLGIIYSHNKQYSQALISYKKALEINPDEADAHLNIGIIYAYHLIDKQKAIFHWKRYMDIKPNGIQIAELRRAIARL